MAGSDDFRCLAHIWSKKEWRKKESPIIPLITPIPPMHVDALPPVCLRMTIGQLGHVASANNIVVR